MIPCPNCGKPVAEDAAHCGHCGHKIEATGKKTMMGFAALSPDDLQQAIREAGERKEAAAAPSEPKADAPKLRLPTPGSPRPDGSAPRPELKGFSLPRPEPARAPEGADDTARTEMLPQVDSSMQPIGDTIPETLDSMFERQNDASALFPDPDPEPEPEAQAEFPVEPEISASAFSSDFDPAFDPELDLPGDEPAHQTSPMEATGPQPLADPFAQTAMGAPSPSFGVPDPAQPMTAPEGALAVGSGSSSSSSSSSSSGGLGQVFQENKKIFMIVGGLFALSFGCCIIGTIVSLVF
ncbi:MAG: hypothetical protein H0U74_04970 [Bradymonadaceae bacterium]|nr:hypothetical protein [Lujinxingiaceae bacterium]